ncbi:MAG: hypothetical protein CMC74_05050 [Flavobacteriaceae bacterium]|nr:hypothetical protein [Flavobacteriaceae bacterium]|tara:strand:- start:12665 stop:12991 length:327 start_codon:yes stop_codon:yes gene_type:complete
MTQTADNGKTVAIISYLTIIGWVIAYIMHNNNKTELGAFHLRQMLGLILLGIIVSVLARVIGIPILIWVLQVVLLVLWILGFVGAVQGEKKLIPGIGAQFQEWFKGIG